jgi:signal transduction histidine kinase
MHLLTKTFLYYLTLTAGVFLVGGVIFYFLIGHIFYNQVDEGIVTEKEIIADEIENNSHIPDYSVRFGHQIEVLILNKPLVQKFEIKDTIISDQDLTARFRYLYFSKNYGKEKSYVISIFRPLDDTYDLIEGILLSFLIMFACLFVLLILINFLISRRVWIPFYNTIRQLNKYNLNENDKLVMPETGIHEFNLLNGVIQRMAEKIEADFQNMKEFIENASHEIQTPLAIIKTKIEMLIQTGKADHEQMDALQSINDSANRLSKLNSGLLLLSKMENRQFTEVKQLDIVPILKCIVEELEDLIQIKELHLDVKLDAPFIVNINPELSEILIGNLLSNAIKHNIRGGFIEIIGTEKTLLIRNSGLPLSVPEQTLFNRFVKNNAASKSLGLGLALIKKICELYHINYYYKCENTIHTFQLTNQESN